MIASPQFTAKFEPTEILVSMDEIYEVNVTLEGLNSGFLNGDTVFLVPGEEHIATTKNFQYTLTNEDIIFGSWKGGVKVYGNFLGWTNVTARIRSSLDQTFVNALESLQVTVIRPTRLIDDIFIGSVAAFVSLIFVNFGCAMHWPTVKGVLKKPIGPVIGVLGQFLLMPLVSFGLGFLIFPDDPTMRLGMFFSGITPGGGSSNIWTFILNGNLNLSLAMTTISTLLSFGLMPAWLFSLGQIIFADADIGVPYGRIAMFVFGLIIPLAIGFGLQRFTPKIAKFMVKILKGFSTTLLLFIIIFAIITNLYIFELFTWQIYVAGMCIPWVGYAAGYTFARIFKQPHEDAIAICIEVGNQNTGISIFLLRYALTQPAADLTTVIPVMVAIMTPVPMIIIFILQKIIGCINVRRQHEKLSLDNTSIDRSA